MKTNKEVSMTEKTDTVVPEGPWKFDAAVTEVFSDMLSRSIPGYDRMRELVTELAIRYRTHRSEIVDLGCSRGDAIAELLTRFGGTNGFVGVEVSPSMLTAVKERFADLIDRKIIRILDADLRKGLPPCNPSVILSVLTLQFIPIEYRLKLVSDIYKALIPGGAFILVEKITMKTPHTHLLFNALYYDMKSRNGYSHEEIERKRLSLEGVLVPQSAQANMDMLEAAGFKTRDLFWRDLNFVGFLAVKES